jgi:EAL and modified HD-GYP domain-containing signal transduction protein
MKPNGAPTLDTFIARQPIFDKHQRVYGYELLFRGDAESMFKDTDPDEASAVVISDSCFLLDLETYAGGKRAFVNVTRDLLIKGYVTLLPKESTVVEIPEAVEPDPDVISTCQELKQAGYSLALGGFVDDERREPLVQLTDIIKVDFLVTEKAKRMDFGRRFAPRGIQLLAEKVDTPDAFREAQEMGYDLFQGDFFKIPAIISRRRDIPGFKFHYLQLLSEIHRPGVEIAKIESIIKREVSLTYKLLRYINSAFFGMRNRVSSIKHALLLLGEKETKKWASFVALTGMAKDKPQELVFHALIRARFCESLASAGSLAYRDQELFLMGMLSLMDTILGRPLNEILRSVPVADDIKEALCGKKNQVRTVLECVLTFEEADWTKLSEQFAQLSLAENEIPQLYREALQWAKESFDNLGRAA